MRVAVIACHFSPDAQVIFSLHSKKDTGMWWTRAPARCSKNRHQTRRHNTSSARWQIRVSGRLKSPILRVADAKAHELFARLDPSATCGPFTINSRQTALLRQLNDLLVFEIGDLEKRQDAGIDRGSGL